MKRKRAKRDREAGDEIHLHRVRKLAGYLLYMSYMGEPANPRQFINTIRTKIGLCFEGDSHLYEPELGEIIDSARAKLQNVELDPEVVKFVSDQLLDNTI